MASWRMALQCNWDNGCDRLTISNAFPILPLLHMTPRGLKGFLHAARHSLKAKRHT